VVLSAMAWLRQSGIALVRWEIATVAVSSISCENTCLLPRKTHTNR